MYMYLWKVHSLTLTRSSCTRWQRRCSPARLPLLRVYSYCCSVSSLIRWRHPRCTARCLRAKCAGQKWQLATRADQRTQLLRPANWCEYPLRCFWPRCRERLAPATGQTQLADTPAKSTRNLFNWYNKIHVARMNVSKYKAIVFWNLMQCLQPWVCYQNKWFTFGTLSSCKYRC